MIEFPKFLDDMIQSNKTMRGIASSSGTSTFICHCVDFKSEKWCSHLEDFIENALILSENRNIFILPVFKRPRLYASISLRETKHLDYQEVFLSTREARILIGIIWVYEPYWSIRSLVIAELVGRLEKLPCKSSSHSFVPQTSKQAIAMTLDILETKICRECYLSTKVDI